MERNDSQEIMKHESKILELLPQIIVDGPNNSTYDSLQGIGLNEDEIDETLDIINQGVGRASLYKGGAKPNQFESYLDENIIFKTTIEIITKTDLPLNIDTQGLHPKLKNNLSNIEDEELDLDQLALDFGDDSNPDREDILYSLIDNKYPDVIKLIEASIFDEDKMVQIVAVQGITKENIREETIPLLIKLFEETSDNVLISNLTQLFDELNIKDALPVVLNKLNEEDLMTIYDCIICLGTLGDVNTIEKLASFKTIDKVAQTFDEDGILRSETGFTIAEITQKTIDQIKAK